jgi:hypothetical protein
VRARPVLVFAFLQRNLRVEDPSLSSVHKKRPPETIFHNDRSKAFRDVAVRAKKRKLTNNQDTFSVFRNDFYGRCLPVSLFKFSFAIR